MAMTGCSSGHKASPPPAPTTTTEPPHRTVRVFAAASLSGAFSAAGSGFSSHNPGLSPTYSFAGSNTLVAQILQGAPADVVATADMANMTRLVTAGVVDPPRTFARNKLAIAVARGNPKHITGLSDLGRPGTTVVLGAPGVPAGDYARRVLGAAHVAVAPASLETDVKAAVAKVASGEADATVAYVTDVPSGGGSVAGVVLDDTQQPDIAYPIAVVKATKDRAAAEAFVASALNGDVQTALRSAGFLAP